MTCSSHVEPLARAPPPTAGGRSGRTPRSACGRAGARPSGRRGGASRPRAAPPKSWRKATISSNGTVSDEREVVDHRQAQHEVGPHPLDERRPLPRRASRGPGTGRPGRSRGEGSARSPSARSCAVEVVDDEVVAVDGDGERRAGVDGHPGEAAVVGAEVEDHRLRRARRWRAATNASLASRSRVGVVAPVAVGGPRGRRRLPLEALDGLAARLAIWASMILGPNPARLQLALHVAARRRRRRSAPRPGRGGARG